MWSKYASWLLLGSLVGLSNAIFEPSSPNCAPNEYWCQDRCGSDSYGQTCCGTPDGQNNLCGPNLKCCLFGCCPSDTNCNAIGACERTVSTTDSSGNPTSTVVTVAPTDTLTNTNGAPPAQTPVTSTLPDGQTVVIVNTVTVTVPPGLSTQSIVTTEGQTITLGPTTDPTGGSEGPAAPITTTQPDGQTVVIVGTVTVTVPSDLSTQSVITTEDQTITIGPTQPPGQEPPVTTPITTTQADGQTVVIVGTVTVPVPSDLTSQSVVTTEGQTITIGPTQPPGQEPPVTTPVTTTQSDGQTVVILGTITVPVPTDLSTSSTVTTDGQTIILPPVITQGETATVTSGQTAVTVGSITIPVPPDLSTQSTVTTDGQTIIISPPPNGDTPTTDPPDTTGDPTDTDTDLPVIPTWPPFKVEPIDEDVEDPESDDDGIKVPCKLWFFSICIKFGGINIGGWKWPPLPPGIYPPGPPPGIEFPPGFSIEGNLPPWPKITIGNDKKPTFSEEPSSCETETASMVATTTSFEVSVSGTITSTTGSQVLSTTQSIVGCNVQDSDSNESTDSVCSTSTVTDEWLSCTSSPGAPSSECSTTSTSTHTGCDITATTHTCTSTTTVEPGATGVVKRMDGVCIEEAPELYVIYPKDGTDKEATDRIDAKLKEFGPTDLYRSDTKTVGVNFWLGSINADQASNIEVILKSDIASIYAQKATGDPLTDADPGNTVVYQPSPPAPDTPNNHLSYVCQEENRPFDAYAGRYYFEDAAIPGDGIPLYVVDTGANLDNKDFARVRGTARWINVGTDVDGKTDTHDDSATDPSNGVTNAKAHGTSMLSLATGDRVGVSKNVLPIIVRMPRRASPWGGATFEDYIEGISRINDDLSGGSGETSAIVLMALYFPHSQFTKTPTDFSAGFSGRMRFLLNDLGNKGALIVTGTGNQNQPTIDGWPANFGKSTEDPLAQLLVVGGSSSNGQAAYGNTDAGSGLPQVVAPAFDVKSADGNRGIWGQLEKDDQYKSCVGTSCATAITAGFAAYLLKLKQIGNLDFDSSPAGLKDYIIKTGWARSGVSTAGICNRAKLTAQTCPWNPTGGARRMRFMRRQDDDQCKVPPELLDPGDGNTSTDGSDTSTDGDTTTTGDPTGTLTDLPTLTGTATTCNSDSTCLSTATSTSCVMPGGGHGSACVTNTYCASCSSTAALPTPTWGELKCNPPNDDHGDIHQDTQESLAQGMCDDYKDSQFDNTDTAQVGMGSLSYWYGVQWEKGCETTEKTQSVAHPLGTNDRDCVWIYTHLWSECTDNGGAGGSVLAGCLRYTFNAVSPYADDKK